MARNRMIMRDTLESETLASVSIGANLLFDRIVLIADDEGLLEANLRAICIKLFGMRDDVAQSDVCGWLMELYDIDCIRFYEAEARMYIHITNFYYYQTLKTPSRSKLPRPPWEHMRDNGEKGQNKRKFRCEPLKSYPLDRHLVGTYLTPNPKRKERKEEQTPFMGGLLSCDKEGKKAVEKVETVENDEAKGIGGRLIGMLTGRE